ncbi:hypothetical protein [uncultured Corynebacterium sp.]|uniref:hypothetical protein n=1 Tax=uncultured Corynebacterium sp. TaxID=159447 RepID=UPI00259A90AB|nr:hypothetical protein [uncultured Corynebacterium sp.]
MTPEEARKLLDGTTPGPWEPHQKHHKVLVNNRQQFAVCAMPGDEPEDYANFNLIAAAPDMAATIAGMRPEYGVQIPPGRLVGVGWGTYETALEHRDAWRRDGYNANIAVRYVTGPQPLGEEQ